MNYKEMKIGDLTFKVPIIQGGMGIAVSASSLASAITNAGGLGVISGVQIGFKEPHFKTNSLQSNIAAIKKEIKKAKKLTNNGPIGVNLMVAMNNYKELVTASIEAGVDVIISGAGLPVDLPKFVENTKTKIIPIVSSLKAARVIQSMWHRNYNRQPDAIIVEGPLAGGHLGFKMEELKTQTTNSLENIVADIVNYFQKKEIRIPVIAAGGIFTGNHIKNFLDLGASGVQMATRFVPTYECDASDAYKQAYINAKEEDIKIIQSPVGMPGRALNNKFIQDLDEKGRIQPSFCNRCLDHCDPKTIPYCINSALINAVTGNIDNGLIFVGQNAHLCSKIESVQDVMDNLMNELNRL